jgi:SAM-dependent methyltransferase
MTEKKPPLPMRPDGPVGRAFGWIMEQANAPSYRLVLETLSPKPGDAILEIGFGTGAFLELCAKSARPGLLAGLDPAGTMLEVAQQRLHPYACDTAFDLRLGTDVDIGWPSATFDCAVALHSFQFWEDPARTLGKVLHCLKPDALICLCLRNHGERAPEWLPNPLSRSPREPESTAELLEAAGFADVEIRNRGKHSTLVVARAPPATARK